MILLNIWKYDSYHEFMRAYIKSLPQHGRGYAVKIAEALKIHPTLLSQIVQGHRELTLEQASLFCDYVKMSDRESDLFIKLVELSRSGNQSLKYRLKRQLEEMRAHYKEVKAHVSPHATELNDEDKSIFYSSWQYSACRMICSLENPPSLDEISKSLNISADRARAILDFLLRTGLIKEEQGRLVLGPSHTHIGSNSPWVARHHLNWRTKNLNKIENITKEELCFTAPFSCSSEDFKLIRESLLSLIKEITQTVSKTKPENVYSVCIDLMKI